MSNLVKEQGECVEGVDFFEIPLGDGLVAWVSPEDKNIAGMGWTAKKSGKAPFHHYYAISHWRVGGMRGEYYLHTVIWEGLSDQKLPDGFLIDHINQDKLDNRRENLRLATRGDNEANKKKRRTQAGGKTTSSLKGVTKMKDYDRKKPWRATITFEKKQKALGTFESEKEAGQAYDKAALEVFGEFAYLNFPDEHEGHKQ